MSRADTLFPVTKEISGSTLYYPQDPLAGGTWLAQSNAGKVAVLLNGAFEAHKHRPPYRKSRGIVLLESFEFNGLLGFMNDYQFDDIEPFTLVHFAGLGNDIEELRWDGRQCHLSRLDSEQAHIWSSAQLYSKEIRQDRERWFGELLQTSPQASDMLHFHHFGGYADKANNLNMDRGFGLRTISISQLINGQELSAFDYHNLISEKQEKVLIEHRR